MYSKSKLDDHPSKCYEGLCEEFLTATRDKYRGLSNKTTETLSYLHNYRLSNESENRKSGFYWRVKMVLKSLEFVLPRDKGHRFRHI